LDSGFSKIKFKKNAREKFKTEVFLTLIWSFPISKIINASITRASQKKRHLVTLSLVIADVVKQNPVSPNPNKYGAGSRAIITEPVLWIRIQCGPWILIQELINFIFSSAGCSLLRAEGFFCSLDVL
jgi:hypothetical protein